MPLDHLKLHILTTWNCTLLNFQRSRTDPQGCETGIRGSSPSSPRRCIFFRNHCCWNRGCKITATSGQHLVFYRNFLGSISKNLGGRNMHIFALYHLLSKETIGQVFTLVGHQHCLQSVFVQFTSATHALLSCVKGWYETVH